MTPAERIEAAARAAKVEIGKQWEATPIPPAAAGNWIATGEELDLTKLAEVILTAAFPLIMSGRGWEAPNEPTSEMELVGLHAMDTTATASAWAIYTAMRNAHLKEKDDAL